MRPLAQAGAATGGALIGTGGGALLRAGVMSPWLRLAITLGGAAAVAYFVPGDFFRAGLAGSLGASAAVDALHIAKRAPYETAPRPMFGPVAGSVAREMPSGATEPAPRRSDRLAGAGAVVAPVGPWGPIC